MNSRLTLVDIKSTPTSLIVS